MYKHMNMHTCVQAYMHTNVHMHMHTDCIWTDCIWIHLECCTLSYASPSGTQYDSRHSDSSSGTGWEIPGSMILPANHGENSCKPKRPNYRPPTLLVYNVNPGLINPVYGRLIGKLPKKVSNHDCWGNTPLINKAWFINPGLTFFPSDLGAVEQLPGQVSLQSKCPMQGLNFGAMLKLVDVP